MVAASGDPAFVAPGRWTESLSRLEAATESSMPNVQTVVIHKRKPMPLPGDGRVRDDRGGRWRRLRRWQLVYREKRVFGRCLQGCRGGLRRWQCLYR